ncbi:metalloprotease [Candidatus Woesearchaeota archaeon]|nr:metalloprotease [Candidatus Woesearchaeota archaeon]
MDIRELRDLVISWLAISLAFAIASYGIALSLGFALVVTASAVTAGIGFLFHELAHKYVARYYGYKAAYYANGQMLIIAVLLSFTGIVFAAPGAVRIMGLQNRKKWGIIAAAGPLMNVFLALLFWSLWALDAGILHVLWGYGFMINSWLALFNMLPFGQFDGAKIIMWSKWTFAALIAATSALFIAGMALQMF